MLSLLLLTELDHDSHSLLLQNLDRVDRSIKDRDFEIVPLPGLEVRATPTLIVQAFLARDWLSYEPVRPVLELVEDGVAVLGGQDR